MAVPTITSLTPNVGHPGGSALVRIDGSNFQLPASAPPASEGRTVAPPSSVRVLFDGVEAQSVRVASATRLYVVTPRYKPLATQAAQLAALDPAGDAVDVEVQNIGAFGEVLGSERVVLADGYTYRRQLLTTTSDLTRLVKQLLLEMRRQIHPNAVLTRSVDWSEDPASILRKVAVATLPAVFLIGPQLRENKLYRTAVLPRELSPAGLNRTYASARTVDLVFGCGAMSDDPNQLLELVNAWTDFTNRNVWIEIPRTPGGTELVRYDLDLEDDLNVDSQPSESNLLVATGSIAIAGLDVIGLPGADGDEALHDFPDLADDPEIESSSTV